MVHLDKQEAQTKYETLDGIAFIEWVTDGYLAAIGGGLTAENMDMLSAEQHAVLCYRYVLDEVMEGGFIQLIMNGYAPYVLEGPFPMVVKKLSQDMSDEDFMAMYEQLEELNELGDDFLDEHQEEVTPAVAKMIVENLDEYM